MIALWVGLLVLLAVTVAVLATIQWRQHKKDYLSLTAIVLLIPIVSLVLYHHWGDASGVSQRVAFLKREQQVRQELATAKSPMQIIAKLKKHLQQDPNSAEGWFLLGRLYSSMGDYKNARAQYAKAKQLQPQVINIQLQWIQADYFARGQVLTSANQHLLQKILLQQPNNTSATNLLAMAAYHQTEYAQAIKLWQRMLALYSPQSDNGKSIIRAIAKAKQQLANNKESAS